MRLPTLGAIASFSVQILAGVAVVIWPADAWIAWGILCLASVGLIVSLVFWLKWLNSNYLFQWPLARRQSGAKIAVGFSNAMTTVTRRNYMNETVEIDGVAFDHCTFTNVNLYFRGRANWAFLESRFSGSIVLQTDDPSTKAFHQLSVFMQKILPGGSNPVYLEKDMNTGAMRVLLDPKAAAAAAEPK